MNKLFRFVFSALFAVHSKFITGVVLPVDGGVSIGF